jgi:hypothetical protein
LSVESSYVALPADDASRAGWGAYLCQGLYHRPAGAGRPRVAFIATHYNLDFGDHYLSRLLADQGFGFLGWNTRFRGNEGYFHLELALEDIALGVRWLREQGVETVVLLGNSGGGSLMAAYQALAAAGDDLLGGELYVSVAAHPGRPQVLTGWMDPSVIDESDPVATDPRLDMYDLTNGPPYDDQFVATYRAAQVARNHRITAWARAELERLREAGHPDRVFTLQRTWADPRFTDPRLDPSERPTPACYMGDPARANRGVFGIGIMSTLRTWMSMWSLEESRCGGEEHLAQISLPALVVHPTMDVGVFPSDARAIFNALATEDKQLVELPGDHYFREPSGAREAVADLIAGWVGERVAV